MNSLFQNTTRTVQHAWLGYDMHIWITIFLTNSIILHLLFNLPEIKIKNMTWECGVRTTDKNVEENGQQNRKNDPNQQEQRELEHAFLKLYLRRILWALHTSHLWSLWRSLTPVHMHSVGNSFTMPNSASSLNKLTLFIFVRSFCYWCGTWCMVLAACKGGTFTYTHIINKSLQMS